MRPPVARDAASGRRRQMREQGFADGKNGRDPRWSQDEEYMRSYRRGCEAAGAEELPAGEWVTVTPSRAGGTYRAVFIHVHHDDSRRLVVRPKGSDTNRTVWRSEIERDPADKRSIQDLDPH